MAIARRRHSHAFASLQPEILTWMSDPQHGRGGAFMDEGAHVALWFLWMFGAPRSVTGMMSTSLTKQAPGIEDNGVLLYRYADGMIGVHQASWTELASTSTIELSGRRRVLVATGTDISTSRSYTPGEPPLRVWHHNPAGPAGDPPRGAPAARGAAFWRMDGPGGAASAQPPDRHRYRFRRPPGRWWSLAGGRANGTHGGGDGACRLPVITRGARSGLAIAAGA